MTAADGIWKKTYAISVIDTELATIYNFEDTISGKKYYIFVERENDKVIMEWASGNAGYAMTGVAKTADDYPTFQIANGHISTLHSILHNPEVLWMSAYQPHRCHYRISVH